LPAPAGFHGGQAGFPRQRKAMRRRATAGGRGAAGETRLDCGPMSGILL